ncbi:MAG: zinc-binding alcohol dehydrogenase family protein [Akkermansiaceae bacterium]
MKAIQFQPGVPLDQPGAALEVEIPRPVPSGHDVLVQVEAIGLNPVDTKVRPKTGGNPAVLGYDAAGTVVEVGSEVTSLKIGDPVYYAGSVTRPGTNSQFHLVDERIVGIRPTSLNAAASAALPLTSLTAWESLFERLAIDPNGAHRGKSLLIIGGAGGVGSIAMQLAKRAGLTVITTASRPESEKWCHELGADHVVNHLEALEPQIKELGFEFIDYIANFNNTDAYWETMGRLIAPQGRIVLIVEQSGDLNIGGDFKLKSVAISWEFMFTRSMFTTTDISEQQNILNKVAELVDSGEIKTTSSTVLSPINTANVIKAHRQLESGKTIGKISIDGWGE